MEVEDQREGVYDGCNKGGGHYGGVKSYFLGEQRKRSAHKLGDQYRAKQSQGYHQCLLRRNAVSQEQIVDQEDLDDVAGAKDNAAKHSHAELLEDDAKNIAQADLPQRQATDNGDRCLTTRIAACIHEHGNEGHQSREERESLLKAGYDLPRKGSRDHEKQQPRDALFKDSKNVRF